MIMRTAKEGSIIIIIIRIGILQTRMRQTTFQKKSVNCTVEFDNKFMT